MIKNNPPEKMSNGNLGGEQSDQKMINFINLVTLCVISGGEKVKERIVPIKLANGETFVPKFTELEVKTRG